MFRFVHIFTSLFCLLLCNDFTASAQNQMASKIQNSTWSSKAPQDGGKVSLRNAELNAKGSVTLAPGAAVSGSIEIEFNSMQPLKSGEVIFSWVYVSNAPSALNARVSTDGIRYGENLLQGKFTAGYKTVNNIRFSLPDNLVGAKHWFLRLNSADETGKEAAAILGDITVNFATDPAIAVREPIGLVSWHSTRPMTNGAITDMRNSRVEGDGKITIAPDMFIEGSVTIRWDSPTPFVQGYVSIDQLDLGDLPGTYLVETSANGATFNEDISVGPRIASGRETGVRHSLPASLRGLRSFYVRLRAAKNSAHAAAVIDGLRIITLTETEKPEAAPVVAVPAFKISNIDPWIEADAVSLPAIARTLPVAKELTLAGPRNDWVTGALVISASQRHALTVDLQLPEALKNRLQIRVAGQVRGHGGDGIVWDPLFRQADLPKSAQRTYNYEFIKDFPKVLIDDTVPLYLWFTGDLRGLAGGDYTASLKISSDVNGIQSLPITVRVLNAELPIQNPLYTITWNWQNRATTGQFIDYGVNTAWINHEEAWKKGARFLLFQFKPSFRGEPIDDKKRAEVKQRLDEIWELVERLKVPLNQWAINTLDEVHDSQAQRIAEYGQLIKELRPQTPIWHNPAWGAQADKNQNLTTTEGTLKVVLTTTDIFCPYSWHLWDNTPFWSTLKKSGKRLWYYEIWGSASRRLSVGREPWRTAPYTAWKYGTEGFGIYSSAAWSGDPYRSKDAGYSVTYPGLNADGLLVSSRGFEGLRQGIQEYKRLYVLKQRGIDPGILSAWVARVMGARSAAEIASIRHEMDAKLEATN